MRIEFPTASRARVRGLRHARANVENSCSAVHQFITYPARISVQSDGASSERCTCRWCRGSSVADEEAFFVVAAVDEPAGDPFGAVAVDFSGLPVENVHADLCAVVGAQCQREVGVAQILGARSA